MKPGRVCSEPGDDSNQRLGPFPIRRLGSDKCGSRHEKIEQKESSAGTGRSSRTSDADRRRRQASRFARILKLLELLQGRARYSIAQLAAEVGCSTRTVQRDLNVLEIAGVTNYHDREWGC